jgi:hypothetical protein
MWVSLHYALHSFKNNDLENISLKVLYFVGLLLQMNRLIFVCVSKKLIFLQCKKRHVNICPEFDRSGTCSKGKSCPYPHKDSKKKTQAAISSKPHILIPTEVCAGKDHTPVNEAVESTRYYQSDDAIGSLPLNLPPTASELSLSETPIYVPSKKRPKIGTLPSFIPL